jgi:hypothetical protein
MADTLMGAFVGAKSLKRDCANMGIDNIVASRSFEKIISRAPSLTVSWYYLK